MLQKAHNYSGHGLMVAGLFWTAACLPVVPAAAQGQARAVSGDTVQLAPGHPSSYVVRKGDTLWDISGRFLVKPWRWPELWKINPQIENPHLIYPGDTVRLIYDEGMPQLTLERGSPDAAIDAAHSAGVATGEQQAQEVPSVAAAPRTAFGRNVKLEPRIREYPRDAISALPLEHIQQFLEFPILVEVKDFELRPYVLDMGSRHSVRAGSLRDRVYVRGDLDPEINSYTVFSLQMEHEDPDKPGVTAVYEAQYVGEVRIIKRGDPAVAVVTKSQREMSKGDRLYPSREINRMDSAQLNIIPHAPVAEVEGRILSIAGGGNLQVTEYQVLLLDVGEKDGVDPGTVLSISTRGWQTEDRIYARQASLRGEKEGRISFEYEDQSPVDSILANFANDIHGVYKRFKELRLDTVSGVPISGLPQTVEIPGSSVGTIMVFRSFPKYSYALVMGLSAPTFIADRVHSPQ